MFVLKDIDELVTLQAAHQKGGRHVHERDLSIIRKGAVAVKNGKIEWIGPGSQLPKAFKTYKTKSLKGKTVLPGLVECHTHLVFDGSRAKDFEKRVQGMTYQQIAEEGGGIRLTVNATRKSSPTNLQKLAQARVNAFIKQGVTTIESKTGYGLTLKDELKILKVNKKLHGARIVSTLLALHSVPQEFRDADEYCQNVISEILPQVARNKLAARVDAFVEQGYFSVAQARAFFEEAKRLGLDVAIHADQLTRNGGASLAIELNAKSADHLVQIGASDIESLAKSDVTCVILPCSDLYLRMKYPPARKLLDEGARVAVSTDFNPGSSPTQDVTLTGMLARLECKMTLPEVLAGYTINAAYALGLENEVGSLEHGKSADFVVLESSWEELFYEAGRNRVLEVWRGGKLMSASLGGSGLNLRSKLG